LPLFNSLGMVGSQLVVEVLLWCVESIGIRGTLFQLGNRRASGYLSFALSIRWSLGILARAAPSHDFNLSDSSWICYVDDFLPYLEQSRTLACLHRNTNRQRSWLALPTWANREFMPDTNRKRIAC
jgi:hypothetical protein